MTELNKAVFEFCLRLGDSSLIIGHRLSEWCGHGPVLEEDIALINIALDHIGRSRNLLTYAGQVEGKNRTEDDLAYHRNERQFRNLLLTEFPNTDFAYTIARQFFFDTYSFFLYQDLKNSKDETIAAIAEKALKEITYHLRHSSEWMLRLGDGTKESKDKIQNAVNALWRYTGEMFMMDQVDEFLLNEGIALDMNKVKLKWEEKVSDVLNRATLYKPADVYMQEGSKKGLHTEHLGFLLAEMQYLPRTHAEAKW
ncbi:MAG: phenylacetate-CoA oxygenase subunit PaaC [Bacteroidetes bacterium]|nr:phenylacetate-CoA oxygenase subunit PaaC [Bacteroidota bacterium]HET6243614.1 1,2-phenylacetyl-CoA epoxidase subunit PaaC [Bacteroidia bacterium]